MSTNPSDMIMDLLKELALIKELDKNHEAAMGTQSENADFEARQVRRREIATQIKSLSLPTA
jgi:hypothetical protein